MKTKLAVIIPTYNNLEMLKPLVSQLDEYNVYVIEDGIREETISWLKKQRKIKKIFHKENKGVAVSWNDGLREAIKDGCNYFAILNDDIMLPKNWWSKCRKVFKDNIHLVSLKTQCHISGWFFIIDKQCVDNVGFFIEKTLYGGEDDEYYERYAANGYVKGIVDVDVWHYGSKTIKKLEYGN